MWIRLIDSLISKLPVLNSPKTSVIAMLSIPPPSSLSNSLLPVPILKIFLRFSLTSYAVINLSGDS